MGKSQETFNKKEKEKKRFKKRQDKQAKKEERLANSNKGGSLDDMMAYVDEFGNITGTPPDPTKKKKIILAENIEIGVPKREKIVEDPIKKGTIEFFNDQKGFGFINEYNSQERFFVHANGCIDKIAEGDKVRFELEQGMKGMNAVRVKIIDTFEVPKPDAPAKVEGEEAVKTEGKDEPKAEGEVAPKAEGAEEPKADAPAEVESEEAAKTEGEDKPKTERKDKPKAKGEVAPKAEGAEEPKAKVKSQDKAEGKDEPKDKPKEDKPS
jgi:cold shock CspA family protein